MWITTQYKIEHSSQNTLQIRSPFPSCLTQQYIKNYLLCGNHFDNRIGDKLTVTQHCWLSVCTILTYIYISWPTEVEGDLNAAFSIATTPPQPLRTQRERQRQIDRQTDRKRKRLTLKIMEGTIKYLVWLKSSLCYLSIYLSIYLSQFFIYLSI